MVRLFTSRYQNPALSDPGMTKVGITLGAPRFKLGYPLADRRTELAPTQQMFHVDDRETFEPLLRARLDRHFGLAHIEGLLEAVAAEHGGRPLVLLCFEDVRLPGEWCHRLVVADWWRERTGQAVEEFPDPTRPVPPKKQTHGGRLNSGARPRDQHLQGRDGQGRLMQLFESVSQPGLFHAVRMAADETLYCTCMGWRAYKRCRHLTAVQADLSGEAA